MGSLLSCDTCPTNVTSSVVNLSEAIVLRVADGIDEPRSKTECVSYEDCGWFEKIKCIDDDHSTQNGLFIKDLELFMMVFERRLKAGKMPEFCFTEHLLRCYKNNANCPLKCYKEKFNFIDCIESQHLEKIRAAAELYYKNKGKKPKC